MLKRIIGSRKFWLFAGVIVGGLVGVFAHKKKSEFEASLWTTYGDDDYGDQYGGSTVADFIDYLQTPDDDE